jgi:hypothetical protein
MFILYCRVLKPANSLRWHKEVLDWIDKWTTTPLATSKERVSAITVTEVPLVNIDEIFKGVKPSIVDGKFNLQQ